MKQKISILFWALLLCFISTANAQGPTKPKLCATCGKMYVNCPYNGNHPKCATCGKVKEKCAYEGNHPKCATCGKVKENCPYNGSHPKCRTCGRLKENCPYNGNHPTPQVTQPARQNSSIVRETIRVKGVSFDMIRVEGGTYWMGAQRTNSSGRNYDKDAYGYEGPVHQESVSTFYMGETEVTQELWQAVMGSNPSDFKGSQRPVEEVSWDDCQTFIKKLNSLTGRTFRLPTEAEWEYAARGGNQSKGYKYAGGNSIHQVAWYGGNYSDTTNPVKQKAPNELGLYDMSGNVWEWTSSYWRDNYNASEDRSHRVVRGGSWRTYARYARVSAREGRRPDYSYDNIGLRLVLAPQ